MQYEMVLKDFLGHNMELFLKWLFILAFVILGIYLFRTTTPQQEASGLERVTSAYITVASFLIGALCSGIAGLLGCGSLYVQTLQFLVLLGALQGKRCRSLPVLVVSQLLWLSAWLYLEWQYFTQHFMFDLD